MAFWVGVVCIDMYIYMYADMKCVYVFSDAVIQCGRASF